MAEKYIVTSALPYINGVKHLGNMIGSLLPADIYARFLRQRGSDVLAICGTDEHGTPAEIAAMNEGLPVEEFALKNYEIQKKIYEDFGLSFDYFGRTSSPENHEMTQRLFLKLHENGLIGERETEQIYCEEDRRFLPDRFIRGTCPHCGSENARGDQCEDCTKLLEPTDLIDPRSATSGSREIEVRKVKHLYLLLPKMKERIAEWLEKKQHWPKSTLGIAKKWIAEGFRERCITRDLKWGVPVPFDGYRDKVFYVWFDAPIGYIGISMEWAKSIGEPDRWREYWKNPKTRLVQFMAKDNVPFHTVTWPAAMMGADDGFVLADMIKGFEWLNYEGGKFSTSAGRGVFTDAALELFPADYWRYYLVLVAPEKGDSDFRWEGFQNAVNKDLSDVLGNFLNRTLRFITRFYKGIVPVAGELGEDDRKILDRLKETISDSRNNLEKFRFQKALRDQRAFWAACNVYFDAKAPWAARKENPESADTTMNVSMHLARAAAVLAFPFIPFTSEKIIKLLGREEDLANTPWDDAGRTGLFDNSELPKEIAPLFAKIDDKTIEKLEEAYGVQA